MSPANGLLPPLTAEGKRRALLAKSDWALPGETIAFDGPADFDSWDRCITRGMPSSMMPYRYNGGFAIRQAPGYVIFDLEMIHEARVIPTDGRPPLASEVKQWMGESRGRWEGNTLVVETTNLPGRPAADQPRRRRLAAGQSVSAQRPDEDDGAHRASQRRHVALRDHDRGPRDPDGAVHGALSDAQRPERT